MIYINTTLARAYKLETSAASCGACLSSGRYKMYSKILVAVDGSESADRALEEALRLAAAMRSELTVVHVIDNSYLRYEVGYIDLTDLRAGLLEGGQILLDEAKAKAAAAQVTCKTLMVDEALALGDVANAIEQVAQQTGAELLVLGTHGRRGVRRLLMGSVAEALVRQCRQPVLLVHAPQAEANAGTKPASGSMVRP
ncbi:universal stress protein [Cupriavidus basilensis]|uniref:universal stress protein n=1 Tax=Cupriavidus basilensis TaxID=68895 RepID=UPI003463C769